MSRLILMQVVIFVSLCIALSTAFECGVRKITPSNRKEMYETEPYAQWPWYVNLHKNDLSRPRVFFCGAALINEWTLVTDAHCIKKKQQAKDIAATFESYKMINKKNERNFLVRNIAEIIMHEYFEEGFFTVSNVAILIMEEAVEFTDILQPICLPIPSENIHNVEGTIAAFGFDEEFKLHSVSPRECRITPDENSFCGKNSTSPYCFGRGSFFMVQHEDTLQWKILGIYFYYYTANSRCDPKDFSVFVDFTKFVSWILSNSELYTCKKTPKKIPFSKFCDGNADCDDESDERHCLSGVKELWSPRLKLYISNHERIDDEDFGVKSTRDGKVEGFFVKNNKNVKFLPIGLGAKFPNLTECHAQSCAVEKISVRNFMRMEKLEKLNLSYNRIKLIEQNSFGSLVKLKTLMLNNNQISDISELTFETLKNLNHLELSFNQIPSLLENVFIKLTELTDLSLKFNQIKLIPNATFMTNTKLKKIDLSFNEIETIDENLFLNLKKLRILDLSENKLTILQPKAFKDLINLEVLFLNHNNLKILQSNFNQNQNLEEIHLHDNKIASIKPKIFNNLFRLRFVSFKDNFCIDKNFGGWLTSSFNRVEFDEEIKTCTNGRLVN